ncbi:MAG: hypothetical protein ACE5LA_06120 [Dehalococcoidales bacterium]
MEQYLVRGKLEYNFPIPATGDQHSVFPNELPIIIGVFKIDRSPNCEHYLENLGWLDEARGRPDWQFPISFLYVETTLEVTQHKDASLISDNVFEQLEALFRLYCKGGIYIRRHEVWKIREGSPELLITFRYHPMKPEPSRLDLHGDYPLHDELLKEFSAYYANYWDIISERPHPLWNAIYRFSLSYEEHTDNDRLIDLMVAMEALYGDYEYHRYKIPLRCSCLLFRLGEERKANFKLIKDIYDKRSRILHGNALSPVVSKSEIEQFEDLVRMSVHKFLDMYKDGKRISSGSELDDLLFFDI